MAQTYWEWLNEQPEYAALSKKRDDYRKQFKQFGREAQRSLRKALTFHACAEKIEESILEWQNTSEENDSAMHRIYGIHPELVVDGQADVMTHLRQQAYEHAAEAAKRNEAARSSQKAFEAVIDDIGKLSEKLRAKFEELEQKPESEPSK
tara:strand:- start:1619 stop:2068 length:450 start_codon:yes stop_codon:yes gene_type:complete